MKIRTIKTVDGSVHEIDKLMCEFSYQNYVAGLPRVFLTMWPAAMDGQPELQISSKYWEIYLRGDN